MKNVSHKPNTLRSAIAQGKILIPADCAQRLKKKNLDKGDAIEAARIAAIMAAKNTSSIIPLCHPLPLHWVTPQFDISDHQVDIRCEVGTVAPTGVEMEALAAVSAAALTLYDMLKPYAGMNMSIEAIKLTEKRGGKSDFSRKLRRPARLSILLASNKVASGKKQDKSGQLLSTAFKNAGFDIHQYQVLQESTPEIRAFISEQVTAGVDLIVTAGSTGAAKDNVMMDAIGNMIERDMPGISETIRHHGQNRTPYAMISSGRSGYIGKSLVVMLPGSKKAVEESLDSILPGLVHLIDTTAAISS